MAHLIPIDDLKLGRVCDTCYPPRSAARRELLSYAGDHEGFYCVRHAEAAMQRLRTIEARALLHRPIERNRG